MLMRWVVPVYEFYCADCHTLFKFLSRRVNTEKIPACPQCGRPELDRQISMFAISKGAAKDAEGDDDFPMAANMDESRMERALMSMAAEAEGIDENDPKQAAHMMRKFCELTGMKPGESVREALARLEAGEDPDQIEAEMGDVFEDADAFEMQGSGGSLRNLQANYRRPRMDDTLYEL
jgi:putative FmdB family regulatory protein